MKKMPFISSPFEITRDSRPFTASGGARLTQWNQPSRNIPGAAAWAIAARPAFGSTTEEMQQALTPPPKPHPLVQAVRPLIDQRRRRTPEFLDLLQPALSCHTPKGLSHPFRT